MGTTGRSNKLPALLGGILLAIGVICAIISVTSVSSFEKPTDVKADKTYYLLGDKSSINSQQCVLRGEGDKPVDQQTVKGFENKISDDGKVKDISLPLTSSKGVVASMEFSKDISGLKYTCEQGKTYISTKSSGTLNILRWLTMFGVLAGLILLISGLIPARKMREPPRPSPAKSLKANSGMKPRPKLRQKTTILSSPAANIVALNTAIRLSRTLFSASPIPAWRQVS